MLALSVKYVFGLNIVYFNEIKYVFLLVFFVVAIIMSVL